MAKTAYPMYRHHRNGVWLVTDPANVPASGEIFSHGYLLWPAENAKYILVWARDAEEARRLLHQPIACPTCRSHDIRVTEVTIFYAGERVEIKPALLTEHGFTITPLNGKQYEEWSTDEEKARCSACGTEGPLAPFGFPFAQDNPPTIVITPGFLLTAESLEAARAALKAEMPRGDVIASLRLEEDLPGANQPVRCEENSIVSAFDELWSASPATLAALQELASEKGLPLPPAQPAPGEPNTGWVVEVPEVHYSRRYVSPAEAATAEEALEVAKNAGGITLDGLEYSDTVEPDDRKWNVRRPLPDEAGLEGLDLD